MIMERKYEQKTSFTLMDQSTLLARSISVLIDSNNKAVVSLSRITSSTMYVLFGEQECLTASLTTSSIVARKSLPDWAIISGRRFFHLRDFSPPERTACVCFFFWISFRA